LHPAMRAGKSARKLFHPPIAKSRFNQSSFKVQFSI
jgi:hypothetical protein